MALPLQKPGQADLCIPAIAVGMQVDLLLLAFAPQPFHQDDAVVALPARPADLDFLSLQPGYEVTRGELTALVGVEDLWPAASSQRLQVELRVKAVGELPAEHVSLDQIHDRHQVEESLLLRDVGDVGGTDLAHSRDGVDIHQARKVRAGIPQHCRAGFLVDSN